ncbi:ADP-heptose--LPS heptosyltransferase 2 [Gammaproteobacteria bacterium]
MNANHILIIAPAWIGDFIMAQSLFQVLRERNPKTVIDIVAPAWTVPLAARMPDVGEAFPLLIQHGKLALATRWRLGRTLRERHYQQAIVLPRSFKAALVPFVARATRRTGYLGEMRWGLLNDIRSGIAERTVDRFVALGMEPGVVLPDPLPLPRLTADRDAAVAVLARLSIAPPTKPVLVLCPGAEYGPAKRWPVTHFAAVAHKATVSGWQVWLFGSNHDATLTTEIQQLSGKVTVDFAGRLSLVEAIDLLSLASAVVTNDSGLMHMAAALDRPLVALFGSSDPRHTPPLSAHATILHRRLPCSPCLRRVCPRSHMKCLQGLTPCDVLSALPQIPRA